MTAPTSLTSPLSVGPDAYGLLTDLYPLTMADRYLGEGLDQRRSASPD